MTEDITPYEDLEKCPYCGFRMEDPCDSPPPDTCGKALDKMYYERQNDSN